MENKTEKIIRYTERHRFWNTQVLTQFGYTINLFTTIGIGFLGFLITTRNKYPELVFNSEASFDWSLFLYLVTLILVFMSVFLGAVSITSRLYDLRLTRHITWTRKSVYSKLDKLLPGNFVDIEKESLCKTFWKVLVTKIDFIGDINETEFEVIKAKFEKLRKQSKILGRLSWRAHKIQIVAIIASVATYALTIF